MFPASFEYYRASSVGEAVRLLGEHEDAKLLAGGHSLIPMLKLRLAEPAALIDIGRIADLKGIRREGDKCRVGSLTTHAEIAASELRECCSILAGAAKKIADPAVRNKGTIGGNIAHADPASDLPAVLVALGASIHLEGPKGKRGVQAVDFFTDLLTTDIREGEVLTHVEVPCLGEGTGATYLKHEHPASGYAVCGAAAVVKLDKSGTCVEARLAYNGVSATPYHNPALSKDLAGTKLDDAVIDQAVNDHVHVDDPLEDIHASGLYRMELAKVYGRRALKAARDRAKGIAKDD